jgi:hypothetical protein
LNILGQLCCPARDQQVIKAKEETDKISQLSQISNLLQVMRMDMTNYAIRQIRPLVQKQHIEQQREYFEKWAQGRGADATQYTVKWIHDSIVELSRLDREMKPAAILQMAYVMTMTHSFVNCPETLINEKERFQMISIELRKQILIAATFLIVAASVPRQYVQIKEQLKSKVKPISDQTPFAELQFSLAELVIQQLGPFNLNDELIGVIRGQISDLSADHSIYKLLWRRIADFLAEISLPTKPTPPEMPKGVQMIQTELASIASAFGKICGLNRLVHGPTYSKIIKAALEENATPLTPRKTSEIDQMARTPESPRATYPDSGDSNPPKPTGLTPRKEKPSKS